MEKSKDIFAALAAPFPPGDVQFRAGATNADKNQALALAYIDTRAVMDRLDQVMTPAGWMDAYRVGPEGGFICTLSLNIDGEWISKEDGAGQTTYERFKGGLSDALKRAAVKWGIGRYLYNLPNMWASCEVKQHGEKQRVYIKQDPQLPDWALPKGTKEKQPDIPSSEVGQSPGNGKEDPKPADATAFWEAAIKVGIDKSIGRDIIQQCGMDYDKAIAVLHEQYSPPG